MKRTLYPIVGNSGAPVLYINHAAGREAIFFQNMLHHLVVMMRVDAQVIHPFPAIGNCRRKDAAAAIRRNAVDGSVGRITAPRAIFNYFVCGVLHEA